jgi:hypothetical protein
VNTESRYRSRKFLVTAGGMIIATAAAYFGFLTPELSTVLLTGMGSYNIANAWLNRSNES